MAPKMHPKYSRLVLFLHLLSLNTSKKTGHESVFPENDKNLESTNRLSRRPKKTESLNAGNGSLNGIINGSLNKGSNGGVYSVPEGCQYSVADYYMDGLGNRLEGIISTFLWSLLTGRVFLMDETEYKDLLCDPFHRSSWWIPSLSHKAIITSFRKESRMVQVIEKFDSGEIVFRANLDLTGKFEKSDTFFFCGEGQRALKKIKFVSIKSGQYFGTALWGMRDFRAELENLFPDRMVFTHVARHIFLPNNLLWENITKNYHSSLEGHLVGLQLRMRNIPVEKEGWEEKFRRLSDCLLDNAHFLPFPLNVTEGERKTAVAMETEKQSFSNDFFGSRNLSTTIFVASLHREFGDFFQNLYPLNLTENGNRIKVHMESATGRQLRNNVVAAEEAFVEMWLLSFSDSLLVSDHSTFGYIAAGLGGLHAFHTAMDAKGHQHGSVFCKKRMSTEPCYFHAPRKLTCRIEGGWDVTKENPYLVGCDDASGKFVYN